MGTVCDAEATEEYDSCNVSSIASPPSSKEYRGSGIFRDRVRASSSEPTVAAPSVSIACVTIVCVISTLDKCASVQAQTEQTSWTTLLTEKPTTNSRSRMPETHKKINTRRS